MYNGDSVQTITPRDIIQSLSTKWVRLVSAPDSLPKGILVGTLGVY